MSQSSRLSPGQRFGAYEIIDSLGAGGMGEVYRARDPRLDRDVALKILPGSVADEPDRLRRFEREAKSLAALNHPNIVTVHSVEEVDGVPFLTMELVEGKPLGEFIVDGGMQLEHFFEMAIPLADAMATAHSRGVVHRDLKPANVMITQEGRVKVVDFGLARRDVSGGQEALCSLPTRTQEELTREGHMVGTVPYMSPDQLQGRPATARSDIFSLGTVFFEMLTGKRPFAGQTNAELVSAILKDNPAPVSEIRSELPRHLGRIVARCLAKEPGRRFQTAQDVRNELEALREEVSTPGPAAAGSVAPAIPRPVPWPRHLIAAGVVALLLVAGATGWLIQQGERHRPVGLGSVASLVALPATVHGPDEYRFLSDAVPASLSTYLTEGGGLKVKAPPSAAEMERLEGARDRIAEIYGVDAVLVSTVTAQSTLFTVNVQLIEPASHELLWSRQYKGTPARYLEMVQQAAASLHRELGRAVSASSVAGFTASSEAELAFRQGQYFSNRYNVLRREEDYQSARDAFLQALELDTGMAEAAAELGFLHYLRVEFGAHSAFEEVAKWSSRALELDASSSLAWACRAAMALLQEQGDEALLNALEAVHNGPDNARAHIWLASTTAIGGSMELGLHALPRRIEVDPFYLAARAAAAAWLVSLERREEALKAFEGLLRIEPEEVFGQFLAVKMYLELDREEETRETVALLGRMADEGRIPREMADLVALRLAMEEGEIDRSEIVEATRRAMEVSHLGYAISMHYFFRELGVRGWTEEAMALLEMATTPEPYDRLRTNSAFFDGEPVFQAALARSRKSLENKIEILEEARRDGKLPEYLEEPLEQVRRSLAGEQT